MKGCAGFWVGMSAGLLAGAAMGMMSPYGRDPMKTQVGKSIHRGQHCIRSALNKRNREGCALPVAQRVERSFSPR